MAYNPNPNIAFRDSPSVDPFSRARVSSLNPLFTNTFLYSSNSLFWTETLGNSGTATLNTDRASVSLAVTGASDIAQNRSKESFRYLPGQGLLAFLSFTGMDNVASVTKRIGLFNDNNGVYFEADGTDYSMVVRSSTSGSAVNTRVDQASWNLDPMDGTGPSGVTLDFSTALTLVIDLQWLGTGRVRFGFDLGGRIVYVHEALHANNLSVVYMSKATLPATYEIRSTGGSSTLEQICTAVCREGAPDNSGIMSTVTTELAAANSTTTLQSLLAVRLRSDFAGGTLVPKMLSVFPREAADMQFQLLLNPTLAGALTFSDTGVGMQQSVTRQTVSDPGHILYAGHISQAVPAQTASTFQTEGNILRVHEDDVLVLATQASTGTIQTEGTITVLELY